MSEEQVQEVKQAPPQPVPVTVNDRGLAAPQNSSELMRTINQIAEGGGFPDCFDNPAKRFAAYNMARSLCGDNFQLALNNIAVIKGKMTIYGELPGALARQTGEVEDFQLFALDPNGKKICTDNDNVYLEAVVGVCKIKRKGQTMNEFTYTIEEARHAGQYPAMKYNKQTQTKEINQDSPWMKFTKVMLMRKAQAMAVKFVFPEAMSGTLIAEYDFDEAPDLSPIKDVTPSSALDKLNKKFGNNSQDSQTP